MGILDRFCLDGRVALVTGAGQGIGQGFAVALAEAGADVAVVDRNAITAAETAEQIRRLGRRAIDIVADVSRPDEVQRMIDTALGAFDQLDVAVNNAGGGVFHVAEEYTSDEWDDAIRQNLSSVFYCAEVEARAMFRRGRGSIINTGSISGVIVNRGAYHAAYNTAKAGVIHMTRALAAEWAPHGVRLNAISPGNILTPAAMRPDAVRFHKVWADMNPMGRLGEIGDLQGAVVFLAADVSAFLTGHNLVIDGGYTLW